MVARFFSATLPFFLGDAVTRVFAATLTGFLGFVIRFADATAETRVLERNLGATAPIDLTGACARLGDRILALAATAAVLRRPGSSLAAAA